MKLLVYFNQCRNEILKGNSVDTLVIRTVLNKEEFLRTLSSLFLLLE